MAISLTLTLRTEDAEKALRKLKAKANPSCARALNRAIVSARTVMTTEIARDMGMKAADVKAAMTVTEATPTSLSARLAASGKRIPLIKLGAKGPQPSRGRGRGVSVKGKRYPNAFLATVGGQHRGVFTRVGSSSRKSAGAWSPNLPIAELKGASIGHVFEKYLPIGIARGEEALKKNLESEFRYAAQAAE